jgi:hypothetical protein
MDDEHRGADLQRRLVAASVIRSCRRGRSYSRAKYSRFSVTVSRWYNPGDFGMTAIRRRISAAPSGPTGMPATTAEPAVGEIGVPRIRTVVVLPAPFGPRNPNTSPAATLNDTSDTAVRPPEDLGQVADFNGRGHHPDRRRPPGSLPGAGRSRVSQAFTHRKVTAHFRILSPPGASRPDRHACLFPLERDRQVRFDQGRDVSRPDHGTVAVEADDLAVGRVEGAPHGLPGGTDSGRRPVGLRQDHTAAPDGHSGPAQRRNRAGHRPGHRQAAGP